MREGEASLVPTHPIRRQPTAEEAAETLSAIERGKVAAEVVPGAGGKATRKIQAEGAKGNIAIEMTTRTLLNFDQHGGDCVCEYKFKIEDDTIAKAGGRGRSESGSPAKGAPFKMVSKYQELVESWLAGFSASMEALEYVEHVLGWFINIGSVSDLDYAKTGNATLTLDCFNCKRQHKVRLSYKAPGTWPAVVVDPVEIWRTYPVNLKRKATRRVLDQFANLENLGLAKNAIAFFDREFARLDAIKGQLATVKEAINLLDLPGSGTDLNTLKKALTKLDTRAESAQYYFLTTWLFKAFSYCGEYWHKNNADAEALLRGNWRAPEWYIEGR